MLDLQYEQEFESKGEAVQITMFITRWSSLPTAVNREHLTDSQNGAEAESIL